MRPDQEKFDQFVAPLTRFDEIFEACAKRNGLLLEKNPFRTPSRMLRSANDPGSFIEMYLDPIWHEVSFSDDLPYSLVIISYYEEKIGNNRVWKLASELTSGRPLKWMEENISDLLEKAVNILRQYKPKYVMNNGVEVINARLLDGESGKP
jgi:hypothetical protein